MHRDIQALPTAAVRIVRQPIHNYLGDLFGYELRFSGASDGGPGRDEDVAPTAAMLAAFSEFDARDLLGRHRGMIPITRSFTTGKLPLPFTPESATLGVLANSSLDEDVVQGASELAGSGYRLGLLDFSWSDRAELLLEIADFVSVDVQARDWPEILTTIARCRAYDVGLMAANVGSAHVLNQCLNEGFDLVSGPHISHPESLTAQAVSPSQLTALTLVARLNDPNVTTGEIDSLVRRDPALVYRLLQVANSASSGARRKVSAIRDALVMVGVNRLRSWLVLLSMSGSGGEDPGLVVALTRARSCEVVAIAADFAEPDTAFTAGLLHGISQTLGLTPEMLIERMPSLSPELSAALSGTPSLLRRILDSVLAYEVDDLDDPDSLVVPVDMLASAYLNALAWTTQTTQSLSEPS